MEQILPVSLSRYLMDIVNDGIAQKETIALERLLLQFDANAIEKAVVSILNNGIPPYGEICVHPLSELVEKPELLSLFLETKKSCPPDNTVSLGSLKKSKQANL